MFTGKDWIPTSSNSQVLKQIMEEKPCTTETTVINFGIFRLTRREIWTTTCYELEWKLRGRHAFRYQLRETPENEARKYGTTFLKQWSLRQQDWKPMKRSISGESASGDLSKFRMWVEANYPEIKLPKTLPDRIGVSRSVNGMFMQVLVTIIIGALTRFQIGTPSHAAWLLVWIYGGPVLRLVSLIDDYVPLSAMKQCFLVIVEIVAIFVLIGLYGGITVILVELFGSMCNNTTITLSPGIWILIGLLIFLAFIVVGMVISYLSVIVGNKP